MFLVHLHVLAEFEGDAYSAPGVVFLGHWHPKHDEKALIYDRM
jgi:hypothetical protein